MDYRIRHIGAKMMSAGQSIIIFTGVMDITKRRQLNVSLFFGNGICVKKDSGHVAENVALPSV